MQFPASFRKRAGVGPQIAHPHHSSPEDMMKCLSTRSRRRSSDQSGVPSLSSCGELTRVVAPPVMGTAP
jgi:hypothetical protein